jgi:hypothetical protein
LDSCTINWTLNGTPQTPKNWTGKLSEDFSEIINLGTYTSPQLGKKDTIDIWISSINGIEDSKRDDDTLQLIVLGCAGSLQGDKTVGNAITDDYPTIAAALNSIRECGLIGDIRLKLKGTYTENVNLSDIASYLRGYKLTITSLDNDADSAIIKPNSGVGITLGNARDITIKNITINTTNTLTHAIQFTGACTNIVIRDCELLTDPTTSSQIALIHKATGTGIADSIFVIKNIMDGGSRGFYFFGGTGTGAGEYATNIVFDSNTVSNNYEYAMQVEYTDFLHISGNTLTSRSANSAGTWYAMSLHYSNGDITCNRIKQSNASVKLEGFHLEYYSYYNTTKRALIANNELIHTGNAGSRCLRSKRLKADILHNTFYSIGGSIQGLYMSDVNENNLTIKNNIVVTQGSGGELLAYSLAGYTNQYDIDYNDFHATGHGLGYCHQGNPQNIESLADLQANFPTAQHMQSFVPDWVDISINADVKPNNTGLYCPALSDVPYDINGKARPAGQVTMGAWQIAPNAHDLGINQFIALSSEVVLNEVVPIDIEVQNTGVNPVQQVVFGWSVNGEQQTSYTWTPPATFVDFLDIENVTIGSFTVGADNDYHIVVWIDSLNGGKLDMNSRNDTIEDIVAKIRVVEWAGVLVEDSIKTLSFDVSARVRTTTGAPTSTPLQLNLTTVKDNYIIYDTLNMTFRDGIWTVHVPEQYFNAKVIYSITVSDTMGTITTITDSTYIEFVQGGNIYTEDNLTMMNMLNPVNRVDEICTPDYSPVEVVIGNLSANDYNYAQDIVTVSAEVINPLGERYTSFIYLNIGGLASRAFDTVTVMSAVDIRYPGRYKIRAWLSSPIDNRPYDDTLEHEFISGRIILPVDEDFSGIEFPITFTTQSFTGTDMWSLYTDTNGKILPPSGNGMLRYTGKRGTMTQLSTRQLELSGSVDPKLEFWYYHDTAANELDYSYTEVKIMTDDVVQYKRTLYRRATTDTGWTYYYVDLTPYSSGECILIQFESVNRYDSLSAQYLAHVLITSKQNLALSEIIISPEITVCDMDNRELKIVLASTTTQAINFVQNPANLTVEISGVQTAQPYLLNNIILPGNAKDTIILDANINIKNVTDIKVYLTSPVDERPDDDTATYKVVADPKLELEVISFTENVNCFKKGIDVYQTLILKNSGNIDLTGIELLLTATAGEDYVETVKNPEAIDLLINDTLEYTFQSAYTVPSEDYQVKVTAWLGCDSTWIDTTHAITECVELYNLSVTGIVNPALNQADSVNAIETLIVTVENTDNKNSSFNNVELIAEIENQQGELLNTLWGNIATVNSFDPITYTFDERYTVPNDSLYFIRVYVNSRDIYPENDTVFVSRTTYSQGTGINSAGATHGFTLGQNIPNPASNSTRIHYSIPDAGDVMFYVHSVNGQLLYTQKINTPRGTHTIELNTATFAAGIYFYSIEYKGQKLVRKLTINN